MKKLTFAMTLMLAVLLASCSKKQGSRLIPDNAIVVLRLDMMKAMESTGMKGDDTSVKDDVEKLIKGMGLDKEVREKLLEIVDDPTSSGIDFTEPVFAYFAPTENGGDAEGGFVGCVDSKSNLEDALKMLEDMDDDFALEEYGNDGVQYVMIDRNAAFIFNDNWFFVGPVERDDNWKPDVDATIEALLDRAAGNNNIEGSDAFQQMCDRNGLLQVGFFGSAFDNIPLPDEVADQLPNDCDLKDIATIANVVINKGEILMECEALPMSEGWEKYIKSVEYRDIEESQAQYARADGALAIINVNPKAFFRYIKKLAQATGAGSRDLEELDELKPVFDALTGEAMVAVNWEKGDDVQVNAYVGTRNNSLVEKVVGDSESMEERGIVSTGDNEYRIPIDYDYDYNDSIADWVMTPTKFMQAGWKNGQTYLLLNSDDEPFTKQRKPFTDVKGIGYFIYASGELLGTAVGSADRQMERVGEAVGKIIDYVEIYLESPTKGIMRIATKKKDKSPIVAIIDYVKRNSR